LQLQYYPLGKGISKIRSKNLNTGIVKSFQLKSHFIDSVNSYHKVLKITTNIINKPWSNCFINDSSLTLLIYMGGKTDGLTTLKYENNYYNENMHRR